MSTKVTLSPLRHVLIPLDGSEVARGALVTAQRLTAHLPDPAFTLLEVVEGGEAEEVERLRAQALLHLREVANELTLRTQQTRRLTLDLEARRLPLRIAPMVEHGRAAERILLAAERSGVDAMAMSTHGRSGMTRLVRGSVAEEVLRGSPVPLLVSTPAAARLAGPDRPFLRLLVPLDGSELAYGAVPLAATLARGSGAEVVLVRADEDPAKAEGCLDVAAELLIGAGIKPGKVWREVASGPTAEALLAALERHRVDLVVMSTHGRRGLDRMRLGSVAEEILRHAPCPVLVRRGAPAA